MNILVTGATGFLGQNLVKTLVRKGYTTYLIVRDEEKTRQIFQDEMPHIRILKGDVRLPFLGLSQNERQTIKNKIDIIYHCAALVKFDEDLREQIFQTNIDGTKHTLQLAKELNIPRFFHVSTAYTLGCEEHGKEALYDTNRLFSNPYEESKCIAEHEVWKYKDTFDISIFRPSIIVGDSQNGVAQSDYTIYGVIKVFEAFRDFCEKRKKDHIRLFISDHATANFIPVDFVVDALVKGIERAEKNRIYHIVTSNHLHMLEIMKSLKELASFGQLQIISTPFDDWTTLERRLMIALSPFQPYLNRRIEFEHTNTNKLIEKERGYEFSREIFECVLKR
ncbi:SDR family oxidoreductase [Anoxybacillus sp. TBDG-1]